MPDSIGCYSTMFWICERAITLIRNNIDLCGTFELEALWQLFSAVIEHISRKKEKPNDTDADAVYK